MDGLGMEGEDTDLEEQVQRFGLIVLLKLIVLFVQAMERLV